MSIDRTLFASDAARLAAFVDSGVSRATLALVYGRRRIGKSTLLSGLTLERGGFYWEATRTAPSVQLARLGDALGAHLGVGRLALGSWSEALAALTRLGADEAVPVVLDEFGHLLEADPSLESEVASALGPAASRAQTSRARLIVCGSAIAMMRALTAGEAPLRGRAGLELVMQPADFRSAARWLPPPLDLGLAARVWAVIGGVIGYATDMVDDDLPVDAGDFDRWVTDRVLSPSATLHHEATTLLAEDPSISSASPVIHHGILGSVANGAVTAARLSRRLGRPISNLDPALKRLVAAGFLARLDDPIRGQRPVYALADPFLQFHYAVLEPHGALLRDRGPGRVWREHLAAAFDSRVRGPVLEEQARAWVRRHADAGSIGGLAEHVGPTTVVIEGTERQLDLVVAEGDPGAPAAERRVTALGEAKAGATVGGRHLRVLDAARAALGARAVDAKLLLFAPTFTDELARTATERDDVELVDLQRLYRGG